MELPGVEKNTTFLKALADGTRLQILLLLSQQEMAVCELIEALKMSQPAVSHHLKILKSARLVKDVREGKWIFYSLDGENFLTQAGMLEDFFATVQEGLQKGIRASLIRGEPYFCGELREKIPASERK
jgi:ArsR family transcriptional regulator